MTTQNKTKNQIFISFFLKKKIVLSLGSKIKDHFFFQNTLIPQIELISNSFSAANHIQLMQNKQVRHKFSVTTQNKTKNQIFIYFFLEKSVLSLGK